MAQIVQLFSRGQIYHAPANHSVLNPENGLYYSENAKEITVKKSFWGWGTATVNATVRDDPNQYYIYKHNYYGEGEHLYILKGEGYYIYEGPSGEAIKWFGKFPFKPSYIGPNEYWHAEDYGYIYKNSRWDYGEKSYLEKNYSIKLAAPNQNAVFQKYIAPAPEPRTPQNINEYQYTVSPKPIGDTNNGHTETVVNILPLGNSGKEGILINPDEEGNATIRLNSESELVRGEEQAEINEYTESLGNSGEFEEVIEEGDEITLDRQPMYSDVWNPYEDPNDQGVLEDIDNVQNVGEQVDDIEPQSFHPVPEEFQNGYENPFEVENWEGGISAHEVTAETIEDIAAVGVEAEGIASILLTTTLIFP